MSSVLSRLSGLVVRGVQKGSEIGIPTVNIELFDRPEDIEFGIYACSIKINDTFYNGVVHYGSKSIGTDDKDKIFCEVHVFNFNEDVYGLEVSVNLLKKIRDVRQFESDKDLVKQIKKDISEANKYFKENA